MKRIKSFSAALLSMLLAMLLTFSGCAEVIDLAGEILLEEVFEDDGSYQGDEQQVQTEKNDEQAGETLDENGSYSSKEDVALYIHLYDRLPDNYITKKEAEKLGWDSSKGNLWDVAPGMSIGGSKFGNYEGLLPEDDDRQYYECDIDYEGGYRNAKRIVYSNDGLIYYTEDHYESFEHLYGEE